MMGKKTEGLFTHSCDISTISANLFQRAAVYTSKRGFLPGGFKPVPQRGKSVQAKGIIFSNNFLLQ